MSVRRSSYGAVLVLVSGLLWLGAAWAQEPGGPVVTSAPAASDVPPPAATTQPASATAPAAAPNPLRSPARMLEFFEAAVAGGRTPDALRCLNLARIDPEIVKEQGAEYVTRLAEILARLEAEGLYDRRKLSDDPTADAQTIGKDPLLLVLDRFTYDQGHLVVAPERVTGEEKPPDQRLERRWQFAPATVEGIPSLHAQLDELIAEIRARAAVQPDSGPAGDPLRSPYHTVQHFLISAGGAKRDTALYQQAMECLDFSLVDAEDFETRSDYVDKLYALLEHLRTTMEFDRETLPKEPDAELSDWTFGKEPVQLILARGPDGRWRFRGHTVRGIPAMVAKVEEARAQEAAEAGQPAAATATPPELYLDNSSPQATMNLFLTAMGEQDLATALTCFDLSKMSEAERGALPLLAGKLWMVLARYKVIVLQEIDSNPDRAAPYSVLRDEAGQIWIGRQRGGLRDGEWLFTNASLRSIDRLYEAFEEKPVLPELRGWRITFEALPSLYVREYLVPAGMKTPWWGLQAWQWVGLVLLVLLGLVIRWMCGLILPRIGRRLLRTETAAVLPHVVRRALTPTATLMMLVAWWAGLQVLDLGAVIMGLTWWFLKIAMTVVGVYAFYRIVDVIMGYFAARAGRTASRLDDVLVPLLQKTLKVVVVAVGFVLFVKMLGYHVTPLLAGLGVGGLAFGLAAQDTLKNFFGSVNVVLDRPFQVGDWVKMGDVEGTVESVGLRSSRIRTFYNSQVTVPNSEIMTAKIDNLGRRRFRRISCMISLTYDTPPEKLEAFCEGVRELIRSHPYTRRDYYHCWVNKFAAASIDVMLYCFHECPDWGTELRERHRLFLDIVRLAKRLGVEFAFPTQTIHMHHESSPPDSAPPPPPSVPTDAEAAMQFGAAEAAKLIRETSGDGIEKPPPVEY